MRREVEVEGAARGRVEVVQTRAAFMALEREWDALVARTDDQIFYRHAFLRTWIDNFAPEAPLRVLTLRGPDGRLRAALPLVRARERMYGLPVRVLCAAANPHSCRFDLIAEEPARAAAAFFDWIETEPGWDVLRLTDVPEGGRAWALLDEARRRGFPVGSWASLQSPYVPLPESPEAYLQRLHTKFKANLRRRRKRLEERGAVSVQRVDGGPDLERFLEEGFRLEQSGWKGEAGTAIAQDGATRGFYGELARTLAGQKALALWFLRLEGRAVGFHFALEHGGRYLLLKPGYDEALRECSPGQLLMDEVLKDCIGRGMHEFDFLGPDMTWKRDWTDRVRPHDWLFIFRRGPLGRALRDAKFRWVPAAKEKVSRWKR